MVEQGLIDVEHVSEHLGVKVNTVYSWVNQRPSRSRAPGIRYGHPPAAGTRPTVIKFNMPRCAVHIRNERNGLI